MRNTSRNFCTRVYSFYYQCPEYCGWTMKMHGLVSWVLLFCLLNPAHFLLTKRRLCVEYKKEHYLINTTYIATLHTETENNCMTSCVRHDPCMAFNYHLVQKKCILMPQVQCMAPNSFNSSWYLFVHLQSCKRQQVWFSVRPADGNWHWITTDDPSNNTDILHVDGVRYVSSILYRGNRVGGTLNVDDSCSALLTLQHHKLYLVPVESSWHFLGRCLISGPRILQEIHYHPVPWYFLNFWMEHPSILWGIKIVRQEIKRLDSTIT